jgi:hypothetical protein
MMMTRQVKRKKLIHALAEMYGVTWAGVEEGPVALDTWPLLCHGAAPFSPS